ncbi:NACHT, LRR and PYD domains-containing protein 3-like isoform X2 [Dysidea avara]|uniref:NACHT, LRR and PYD domains-containing protein 3-like isoform X2 n=1 Tax=Dysidea avara TaxID=196820 RepID=UPI003324B41D
MEYLKVLKDFNVKLITSLPMKDVVFLATLNQKGLFSGNIKAELKAKSTSTEAADYFLDHKIEKDLANGNNDSFLQLLSAMEEYNTSLKPLVTEINQVLTAVVVLPVASKGEESLDVANSTVKNSLEINMLEGIAFYKHMNLFEDEQDCSCVLEDLEEHKLLSKHVIARLRGITNKKRKNRLAIEEIAKILTPYNFALICSLFYSKPCYTDFVDSIIEQLAIFQCTDVILNENFRLDIFLDLLYKQKFFSIEECKKIECYMTFNIISKQEAFIDVLKAKPVDGYYDFQTFFDCLNRDRTLNELELKIIEKKRSLQKIIVAYRLASCNNLGSLRSSGNLCQLTKSPSKFPVKDLLSDFVSDQKCVLDQYYRYLKNRYLSLPEVSLQGWHDSNINTKKFTDITIVKSIQTGEKDPQSTSTVALLNREVEYSIHKCKSYDEIFKFDDNENGKLLILIEGNAGTGKTTFAQIVCKKWSSGDMLGDYSFVVLIRLRDQKPGAISEPKDLFINVGKTAIDIHTELSSHPTKRVLFWLEGWDELHDGYKVQSVFTQLLTGEVFPQAVVVVSTRPLATANLNSLKFVRKFNLVGFDKSQIKKCAHDYFFNYYHDHTDLDSTFSKFMEQLESVHALAQLAEVPLNLAIILKLFVHNKMLPTTLTSVYTNIVLVILQYHKNRNYLHRKAITSVDDVHIPPDMKIILRGLEKHAYDTIITQRPFTFEEISEYIPGPLDEKEFDGMGFFQIIEQKSMTGESNSYLYRYKVIQEYLAAIYLTRLETEDQKQELVTIFGEANFEMVWIFYAGITGMTRIPIQFVLPRLVLPSQSNVKLPVHTRRDVLGAWMQCHNHFMDMTRNNEFSVDFLLTQMLCCYEAKNPKACKIIADYYYPINICRIEIPPNRATPYMLLAVSYFIAHSGKKWSLRCVSAIPSGVELLCKYINDPKQPVLSDDTSGLWSWCFVVKPSDIDAYIKAIKSQPNLQWIHLLNGSHLGDDYTTKLCECLKIDCNVIRIVLENCGIGSIGLRSIAYLLKINRKILHLDLRKNSFSLDDVINFLLIIKDKTLLEYLLVDKEYSKDAQVRTILQDINLRRRQQGQLEMKVEDR